MRGGRQAQKTIMVVQVGERCPWGVSCKFGAAGACRGTHSAEDLEHFALKKKLQVAEAQSSCAYCVRSCCRYGARCRRGVRDDSDYASSGEEEGSGAKTASVVSDGGSSRGRAGEDRRGEAEVAARRWTTSGQVAQYRKVIVTGETRGEDESEVKGGYYLPLAAMSGCEAGCEAGCEGCEVGCEAGCETGDEVSEEGGVIEMIMMDDQVQQAQEQELQQREEW